MVLLAGAGVALAVLGALAANAATSDARWPGVLDLLRRNSWESVAGTALLAVLVAAAVAVRQEKPAAAPQRPAWRIFSRPKPMVPEIRIVGPPGRERRGGL